MAPWRPTAFTETESETTRRLRKVPPAAPPRPTERSRTGETAPGPNGRPGADHQPGSTDAPPTAPKASPRTPDARFAPGGRPYLSGAPVADAPASVDPPRPTGVPSAPVGRPYLSDPSVADRSPASGSRPGVAEMPPTPADPPRPPSAPSGPTGRPYLPNTQVADPLQASGSRPGAAEMPPAPPVPPRPPNAPPAPGAPDPALSWSAPYGDAGAVGSGRPVVSLAQPDVYGVGTRPRTFSRRVLLAAACAVVGLGLIGGALTGSWLTEDDSGDAGARTGFTAAGTLWHSVPVDQLFPPTIEGDGAGPGGADRTWTRIAVAPDTGCADAFDPLLLKALAPVGCQRLLRATYTDETQSYVTTVGLLFTKADVTAMGALRTRFSKENLDKRADLMPRPYAAKNTVAAGFTDAQRASWTISVLTDAPVVAYAVSGWADGRRVDAPQPAEEAMATGATTAPAQAGLGHEAKGLADRVERAFRKTVGSAAKQSS